MESARRKCNNNNRLQNLWVPLKSAVTASRQHQTQKCYDYAFKAFVLWCTSTDQISMPASAETVALYLVNLVQTGSCKVFD